MPRSRNVPSSSPEQDPAEQPLWRGQLAPVEGAEPHDVDHRRGPRWSPQVSRIIIGFVLLGVLAAAVVLWVLARSSDELALADLETGDCLISAQLRASGTAVDDLERTDCDAPHDAEVFAAFRADDEVDTREAAGRRCGDLLESVGGSLREITLAGLEVRPMTATGEIDPDTRVVCFLRHRSGEKMSGTMVDDSTEPHVED